jgi:hypothetical protein
MPARAMFLVEALPCADRFRGDGPLLQRRWMHHPPQKWARLFVGAGHARESVRSGWSVSLHPPLSGAWPPPTGAVDASPAAEMDQVFVGAAHGRKSTGSGRRISMASTAFGGMAPSYRGGGCTTRRRNGPSFCSRGPWPRKRRFRSTHFHGLSRFRGAWPPRTGAVDTPPAVEMGQVFVGDPMSQHKPSR